MNNNYLQFFQIIQNSKVFNICDICAKHGAGRKWYLNAQNYLQETYDAADSVEYLTHIWGNLERAYVNKVFNIMNMKWMSKRVDVPILGKILKWYANRGFKKDGRKKKLRLSAVQGHLGQVVPLEEAKIILRELAGDTIVRGVCPCKFFNRGINVPSVWCNYNFYVFYVRLCLWLFGSGLVRATPCPLRPKTQHLRMR